MKKVFTYILLFFLTTLSSKVVAQNELNELENRKEIQSISINKKMFEMITSVKIDLSNPTDKAYYELVKKLELLKVLSTTHSQSGKDLLIASDLIIKNQSLKQFNTTNNQSEKSETYIGEQDNSSHITQLLLVSQNKEENKVVIMYISGNFSINELPSLTGKMNIPIPLIVK